MPNPVDVRIAADNAAVRAVARREAINAPQRPPLPDRALIGERLADHGKDSGREARTKLADALADLCKQVGTIRKNPTINAAQEAVVIADAVRGRVDRLLLECEEQGALIDAAERAVEQGIDAALTPSRPEWYALAAEYRTALLDMTDDQRADFVERLQGTRDMAVLRFAIASVPAELSGVSFGVHRTQLDTLLALKDPSLLTRPKDLVKRRAALAQAEQGIRRTAAELADFEKADAIKALTGDGAP